jgi:Rrf2 family protein
MLTNKGKYGIKALLHLAALPVGTFAQTASIASENNISKKFLDAIMFELKNAGFLYSKKGPGGGFSLARSADEIRIGYVIRVLDGPLAPIACASHTAYVPCRDCRDVETCRVRLLMLKVRNAMADILDNLTLAALCAGGGDPGASTVELLAPDAVGHVPAAASPKKMRRATVTA